MDISRALLSIMFSLLLFCLTFVGITTLIGRMLPKGDELAFAYAENPYHSADIYIMDVARGLAVHLLDPSLETSNPAWSLDGGQIAFEESSDIYIFDFTSSTLQRLTNSPYIPEWDLAWSPDGNRIAFTSYDVDANLQLFIVNADGHNLQQISTDGGWHPSWSPDNSEIVFGCFMNNAAQVCIMSIDVDNYVHITPIRTDSGNPAWSPDGSQILSTCFTARDSFLCVMNRMGESRLLLEDQYRMVTSPIWSSDGRLIVFVNSGDLYMTNPDGSDVRRLAYGDGEYASPAWRP